MKTKKERFETVAAKRVQKVLDDLVSLSKCANKNNYEFSEEDVYKMMNTIKKKLKNVDELFKGKLNDTKDSFKF